MSNSVYISRNFTEFGAFSPGEIVDFQKRGILCESDFVRLHGSHEWQPLTEWLTSTVIETPASSAAPAPEKKAVKAKSTTKKATAKATAKKAKDAS